MEIEYDFDGSLHLEDIVEDFFYSSSTGLYVSRHPLVVDDRVLEVADALGIKVDASPEKWLVNTPLSHLLLILDRLGSTALSLPEYFRVKADARAVGDDRMIGAMEPSEYLEALATVFVRDRVMIHHPSVAQNGSFSGTEISVTTPEGRYGWIDQKDIDLDTGLPKKVSFERNVEDETIKYWDTHTDIGRTGVLMAVRGYVTSVGKISLDLGFPADAISHKLTIRECKRARPAGVLDDAILRQAKRLMSSERGATRDRSRFLSRHGRNDELLAFVDEEVNAIHRGKDLAGKVLRENIWDVLGMMWTCALAQGDLQSADAVRRVARRFSGLSEEAASDARFKDFLLGRRERMNRAAKNRESIVFVRGHENPDTDTVVSAIGEAFRQHILLGDGSVFVPVVPGHRLPEEVTEILGDELARSLVLTSDDDYKAAASTGRPEWIMVDHSLGPEQPDTRAILDHHYPSDVALRQQIPRRIILAGSSAGIVAQKFYGLGIEPPPILATLLHGTTLMDTENRLPGKMTARDELLMDRLSVGSKETGETPFYQRLMTKLISCYDAKMLFQRDYKEDWCFGFAVTKGIGILDRAHAGLVEELVEMARSNNRAKNLPLTLLKVVDYDASATTIRRERMYPVFREDASHAFRETVHETIIAIIRHESPPDVRIERRADLIEYWGVGTQLSRKKLAPVLDPVVAAFNRYFYSPSTGLYLKRDFLRISRDVEEIAQRHGLRAHTGKDGVVVGNPGALKLFLQELGLVAASPGEYWKAFFDAKRARDVRMVAHLTSHTYLEALDAIVEDSETLVEHPKIVVRANSLTYEGGRRTRVHVPAGEPGLFDPDKIDLETGLPREVEDPQQYGKGLWRYWSPDSPRAWVLRSTIFAYDIPSLDLKFDFSEALPRLTMRPCLDKVSPPKVRVREGAEKMIIEIEE